MHWKPHTDMQAPSSRKTSSAECTERPAGCKQDEGCLQNDAVSSQLTAVVAKHCDGCLHIHLDPIHTALCRWAEAAGRGRGEGHMLQHASVAALASRSTALAEQVSDKHGGLIASPLTVQVCMQVGMQGAGVCRQRHAIDCWVHPLRRAGPGGQL